MPPVKICLDHEVFTWKILGEKGAGGRSGRYDVCFSIGVFRVEAGFFQVVWMAEHFGVDDKGNLIILAKDFLCQVVTRASLQYAHVIW